MEHYADDKSRQEVVLHEFGHILGFDHNSNMTIGNGFWWKECSKMYHNLSVRKEMPVYSRGFLKSRQNKNRYYYTDATKNHPSKTIISSKSKNTHIKNFLLNCKPFQN